MFRTRASPGLEPTVSITMPDDEPSGHSSSNSFSINPPSNGPSSSKLYRRPSTSNNSPSLSPLLGASNRPRSTARGQRSLIPFRLKPARLVLIFGLILSLLYWHHKPAGIPLREHTTTVFKKHFHSTYDRWNKKTRPIGMRGEWECDPFQQLGRLNVDFENITENVWRPYDPNCSPSNYLKDLYRLDGTRSKFDGGTKPFLDWFANRTIFLHGDSIDRYHLQDFCNFVGGTQEHITPKHSASPKPYKAPTAFMTTEEKRERERKESAWENRPADAWELTSPWTCNVKEYNTTLVNVFNFGFEGAETLFENERWYHPPARWTERFQYIAKPLLKNLAQHFNRPEIERPDLIIINSGYWDLRRYTEEDFIEKGIHRPYPEDHPIPYVPLTKERERAWEKEARYAIKTVAKHFKGTDGTTRTGPTLLWRSLHHPPQKHNYAPFPRVSALDNLARKVVQDLQFGFTTRSLAPEIQDLEDNDAQNDLGLDERLRIDESGKLLLGQEMHFRDLLHPHAVPGSYLWGNVMLYELKRAVMGVGRSHK